AQALRLSGADGVMIGRGCYGRPWLLRDTAAFLKGRAAAPPPAARDMLPVIENHYEGMMAYYGIRKGVQIARKHLGWYLQALPGGAEIRPEINKLETPGSVLDRLRRYFQAMEAPVSL